MFRSFLVLFLITALAVGLRLYDLEAMPIHTDEAVHGFIIGHFLETGVYRYDPVDYHGPSLNDIAYGALASCGIRNVDELQTWQLRTLSVLLGGLAIFSLGVWMQDLGMIPVLIAASLMALGAPFVYYHRYFIHEGLFVGLSLLLLHAAWRALQGDLTLRHALVTGIVLGLLLTTKETALIVILSISVAVGGEVCASPNLRPRWRGSPLRVWIWFFCRVTALAIAFSIVLFSSFGTNLRGPVDAVTSLLHFSHRAGGEGHQHPFFTYVLWFFAPNHYSYPLFGGILLVLTTAGLVLRGREPLVRFLATYGISTFFIYSWITYKTPWLFLNVEAPLVLLAAVGTEALSRRFSPHPLVGLIIALFLMGGLFRETRTLCWLNPADPRNPLAYSPTAPDIVNLVTRIDHKVTATEPISVISEDYWPIPWFLRHHPHVGYWNQIPTTIPPGIIITSPRMVSALEARLGDGWTVEFYGQRADTLAILLIPPSR